MVNEKNYSYKEVVKIARAYHFLGTLDNNSNEAKLKEYFFLNKKKIPNEFHDALQINELEKELLSK